MVKKLFRGVVAAGLLLPVIAGAQVNNEAYRDYFLVGQFGEVCTMCEVVVLCERGLAVPVYERIPDSGDFTLYYIQTRTFWSQIATIWEWFVRNFSSNALAEQGHTRPVWIYEVGDGKWSGPEIIDGRFILDPGVIELDGFSIDRVDRAWLQEGQPTGFCQRLPLWESIEVFEAHATDMREAGED